MKIKNLYKYLPQEKIEWDIIENELLLPFIYDLKNTNQEAKWHGEGDVWTHTKMVCEALINERLYHDLTKEEKLTVFLAALFHDIAKPICTKIIDGEIRSFHHPKKGALITREYFWKKLGLAGDKEYQEFREAICLLVKYHSEPTYFNYEKNKEKLVIKLSLNTKLTKYYSNKLLTLLAISDVKGRISNDTDEKLEIIKEFEKLSIELDCYNKAFDFIDEYSKVRYLSSNNIWHSQKVYDTTWGEVIIICGLPGTGKDTFIKNNLPNYNIISLDDIREKYKIKPTDNQGEVYNIAKEMAKNYLREKIPFIWNATNITELIREKQIKLFHEYNAKVKVIFLETSWNEMLKRNANRKRNVSEKVISEMLEKLEMVENYEAEFINWICI